MCWVCRVRSLDTGISRMFIEKGFAGEENGIQQKAGPILRHTPVLAKEVLDFLRCEPHRTYVDATLGGGGHSLKILERTSPNGKVIGIDWDEEAIDVARRVLQPFAQRVTFVRENFVRLPEILHSFGVERVDGILFDLGLSSIHLESIERGFSLLSDGPLDMRMDNRIEMTAAQVVNLYSEGELETLLRNYGEEPWAKQIARAIVAARRKEPIQTTQALRRIVHRAIPARFHSRRIDPATRTFQALRIHVNQELENLKTVLQRAWTCLGPGGRICVISFHSLEDRIVKETFRNLARQDSQEAPLRIVTRRPVTPSPEERMKNPRSRGAKLRCAERL